MRKRISSRRDLVASAPLFFVVTLIVGLILSSDSVVAGVAIAAFATVVWVGLMALVLQRRAR